MQGNKADGKVHSNAAFRKSMPQYMQPQVHQVSKKRPVSTAGVGIVRRQYGVMAPEHARFQMNDSEATRGMLGKTDRTRAVAVARRGLWLRLQAWIRDG